MIEPEKRFTSNSANSICGEEKRSRARYRGSWTCSGMLEHRDHAWRSLAAPTHRRMGGAMKLVFDIFGEGLADSLE
ncbi:MAG: hypothetical protein M0C28_36160 [Candidatus Moduliflexus flocculans]|nr:hypothetical protein [Candidatus Moduliflexus flocculans]